MDCDNTEDTVIELIIAKDCLNAKSYDCVQSLN